MSLDAKARLIQIVALVGFLVVWQLVSTLGIASTQFISSPVDVIVSAIGLLGQGTVWTALAFTGQAMLFAFVIGTALGVIGGFAIGLSRTVRDAYFGAILFIMSTPKSIFIPIFLLIFGIGPNSAIAYASFATFFYVCVNVVGGIGLVEDKHLRVVKAYRGGWRHQLIDVVIPAAAPGIFSGAWYGIKHSVLEVLIMELYISTGGIGALIQNYSNQLKTGNVLALVLFVVIVSILLGTLWTRLELRMSRWRPQSAATSLR
jgi:NitT/TauT family transport system permease protein